MKSLINRYVSLFLLLTIIAVSIPGCFTGGSGSSDNPVASAVTQTETDSPVRAGTATVSFVIVMPDGTNSGAVRASTASANSLRSSSLLSSTVTASLSVPTASATLFVDGKIAQRKSAPVVNGSVTLTFTGVQDSGTARLDLELIGCSVSGVTFFTGTSQITQNTVIVLSPSYPAGSNRSSDGKLLVTIGETYTGRIAFNDVGQPIDMGRNGYIVNAETGENLFDKSIIDWTTGVGFRDIAWFNGKLYIGGNETLIEADTVAKTYKVYGDPSLPVKTFDSDTLDRATFKTVRDLQAINGSLYLHGDFDQVVRIQDNVCHVTDLPFTNDGFSILDNGDVWVFYCWENNTPYNIKLNGSSIGEKVALPGVYGTNTAISYGSGVLFAREDAIYYWDGSTATEWLTKESIGSTITAPNFFIYKNQVGQIYVCSERENKIWKVQQ